MRFLIIFALFLSLILTFWSQQLDQNDFTGVLWKEDEVIFEEGNNMMKLSLTLLFLNDGEFTLSTTFQFVRGGSKETWTQDVYGEWSKLNNIVHLKNEKRFEIREVSEDSDFIDRTDYLSKIGFEQTYIVDYFDDSLVLTSTHKGGAMIVLNKEPK